MLILDTQKIKQKVTRLAFEIIENNYDASEIILLGVNNTGYKLAEALQQELTKLKPVGVFLDRIKINPQKPKLDPEFDFDIKKLNNKVVIIVDDVANTGRTLFYLFKPFMEISPRKIEVAVLVNRKHKSFPISVDYVGMELATTMMDNIKVTINETEMFATLE